MAEVLEAVLSESILDQLASDLGVDSTVLRKHPFFRVLKGRVLLTYPLRVAQQFPYEKDFIEDADFDIVDAIVLEEGWFITGFLASGSTVSVEVYDGVDWEQVWHDSLQVKGLVSKFLLLPHCPAGAPGTLGSIRIITGTDNAWFIATLGKFMEVEA